MFQVLSVKWKSATNIGHRHWNS